MGRLCDGAVVDGVSIVAALPQRRGFALWKSGASKSFCECSSVHAYFVYDATICTARRELLTVGADLAPNTEIDEFQYAPGYLKRWSIGKCDGQRVLTFGDAPISLARDHNGLHVAVGTRNGWVHIMSAEEGSWDWRMKHRLGGSTQGAVLRQVAMSADGKLIAATGELTTMVWRAGKPSPIYSLEGDEQALDAVRSIGFMGPTRFVYGYEDSIRWVEIGKGTAFSSVKLLSKESSFAVDSSREGHLFVVCYDPPSKLHKYADINLDQPEAEVRWQAIPE